MRTTGICIFIAFAAQAAPVVRVPFVGCKSDGQVGPLPAPQGASKVVQLDAGTAQKLAYYKAGMTPGVLAPRGWYCFEVYGSSGSTLFITPQPIGDKLFPSNWPGITGPGIQVDDESGDTSGRYVVGRVIARVFPKRKVFVQSIIEADLGSASDFPFGPYPNDRLIYRGDRIVEYQTPPHSEGLGTMSRLRMDDYPIDGVAMLQGPTPDLLLLSVRLPAGRRDLTLRIIQQIEREHTGGRSGK